MEKHFYLFEVGNGMNLHMAISEPTKKERQEFDLLKRFIKSGVEVELVSASQDHMQIAFICK